MAVLVRSRDLCWRSWAALGGSVAGLGLLLKPMLAVLGRSWDLCCRSWAALGAYAGGLGAILEPKWSVLSRSGRSWKGQGRKVAQARRRSGAGIAPNAPNAGLDQICLRAQTASLSLSLYIYIYILDEEARQGGPLISHPPPPDHAPDRPPDEAAHQPPDQPPDQPGKHPKSPLQYIHIHISIHKLG